MTKNKSYVLAGVFCSIMLLLLTACAMSFQPIDPPKAVEGAQYVGVAECAVCHDDVFRNYRKTIHYRIKQFEAPGIQCGCESCHGPGSKHVKSKGKIEYIQRFTRMTPAQGSAICLQCHTGDQHMNWYGSSHAQVNVGCISCHKSHKITAKKMLYKGEPELCYDCHQEMRAKAELPSHHPIREHKMKCTACHNTHGAEQNAFKARTINDLCYNCHTDKQGPFIYDHPPAQEGCTLCHDPHGTIANNLLKQSEPFLCLRCHIGHRGNPAAGRTRRHPNMPTFLTSCTQCHDQIHGSDLPSQMGNNALTR